MTKLREWFWRLMGTLRMTRPDRDIEDELRFHLEMEHEAAMRRGESREGAIRQTQWRVGSIALALDQVRDQRGLAWLQDFLGDCRYAVRLLQRSPLFTVVAVLSLALGIGANTAIFSLIDTIMLRSMPVVEPDRLVEFMKYGESGVRGKISYPLFDQFRTESRSFTSIFAHSSIQVRDISFGPAEESVRTAVASADYYSTLGIQAALGRTWGLQDERAPVAVVSYAYWQQRLGSDPNVIGKTFRLNKTVFTIVGVTPKGFVGPIVGDPPEVTLPLKMDAEHESWITNDVNWLSVMARLKAGVNIEQAQTEVSGLFRRAVELEASKTELRYKKGTLAQRLKLRSAAAGFVGLGENYAKPLIVLMGVVAILLLLACSNLANLLLARSMARRREISVRLAVGAGRGRIIRQLMAENLLLAVIGGAAGIALALWLSNSLIGMMSASGLSMQFEIRPDLRVLGFTAAMSLLTCFLFGLIPSWQVSRLGLNPTLKEGRLGDRASLRQGLVVVQIALSALLVIGAGIFVRTLVNLYSFDAGFDRHGVLMFGVDLGKADYKGAKMNAMRTRILERLNSLPGVESASFANIVPLSGVGSGWGGGVTVEDRTPRLAERDIAQFNAISPGHFRTLRTPILLGRDFTQRDLENAAKVVIINETFAKVYFGGMTPLGTKVNKAEVVGVVKDMKYSSLRQEIPPTAYWPLEVEVPGGNYFVRGPLRSPVTAAVREIDSSLRVGKVQTLEEHVDRTILRERLLALLAGFFGVLALILSCVGIYGVTSFQVARRTNEIGIRMALGARPAHVAWMVLREIVGLLLLGLVVGFPVARLLTSLAEDLLFGLKPLDAATYAMAAILLGAVTLCAGAIPAWRATRVDPNTALRYE